MAAQVLRTVCPRNCYCTCGMLVTVQDGRIVRIEGDPKNPATNGRVCLKGIAYARRVAGEDDSASGLGRLAFGGAGPSAPGLVRPLRGLATSRRQGPGVAGRGTQSRLLAPQKRMRDGSFVRVSWEQALDEIAARLEAVRRESGPGAVLYYEGSGSHGALGQLSMAFWHLFGGCTLPYGDLCWPAGLEATRLTYGANLHNHPRLTTESRFVLIWGHNPAETNIHQMRLLLEARDRGATLALIDPRETDTSDFVHVHLKPRPGTDAALALGIARVVLEAKLHDAEFVERWTVGLEAYRERLREYPPELVAAITGLAAAEVEQLALAYARSRPALLIAGFGLQRQAHAGQTMRAVALLPALTGNVGVAGGGWQYANLASHCLQPLPAPLRPAAVREAFPVARLGHALAHLENPPLRAAWIEKANPASQNPNTTAVRQGLESLDLVVVVDQFMTDTARLAHYVLPAKSLFEQEDLVTAYWHPYVQLRARVFDPPGEVKPENDIWRELAARLDLDTSWFPADTRSLLRMMLPPGQEDALERLADGPLDLSGHGDVAFADRRFPTPSGKVEFASEEAARLWNVDPVPDWAGDERPGEQGRTRSADLSHPAPGPRASIQGAPGAARFPLQLLSCKTRDRIHSQFGQLDWIQDIERPHVLDMHPADARERNVSEGEPVVVFNEHGRFRATLRIDHGIRQGVVHVLEGRSHDGDPEVNAVIPEGVTDMGHGATFYDCRVEVQAAGGRREAATGRRKTEGGRRQAVSGRRQAVEPAPTGNCPRSAEAESGREGGSLVAILNGSPPAVHPERHSPSSGAEGPIPTGFLADLGRCTGCAACVLACRLENGWPSNAPWRRVVALNRSRNPNGPTWFLSLACNQCEKPACVSACPSGALEKGDDGVVRHRPSRCLGCRYCEMACPFGAPQFDSSSGVMRKCEFCHERVARDEQPACIAACPTGALQRRSDREATQSAVPGFLDTSGCMPRLRFRLPRGVSARRLEQFLKALRKEEA